MSKCRNRSVRKKIDLPSSASNYPVSEKLANNNLLKRVTTNCFGEPIHHQKNFSLAGYSHNDFKVLSDIPIHSCDKSSSSSASWGEEYELEATQKVQEELDRLENVLLGMVPIPSNYDHDEYQLWMKTFPNFSITGEKMKLPTKNIAKNLNNYEELIVIHPDSCDDCDTITSDNKKQLRNDIKSAVIDKIYKNVSKRLFPNKSSAKTDNERKLFEGTSLETDFEDVLHVSPVHLNRTRSNRSSHSVSQSHILASRWLKDDSSPEFTSLPFFSTQQTVSRSVTAVSAKSKNLKYKSVVTLPKTHSVQKNISLPPINSSGIHANTQFRSISATPRNQNKSLSAISVQVDSLRNNRSRVEVINYLDKNEVLKKSPLRCPRRLEKINKKN